MAGISAPGVGSGLDINGIISQLMSLERRPLESLNTQKSTLQSQLSSLGKLKSSLSGFQSAMSGLSSASKFKVFSATSEDDTLFTASADSDAAAGTYKVEVTQLAQAHKIASSANGITSTDTFGVAGDTIQLAVGASSFQVDVGGKTLAQIRDAVNSATDNAGVTATIISETNGERLVFTSNDTGASNGIAITDVSGTVASTLQITDATKTELAVAQDAEVFLEGTGGGTGYQVTSSTNKISGAISGITLDLKATSAGAAKTLTVTRDTSTITENVQSFIDKYNDVFSTLSSLRSGAMSGDTTLNSIENQIRGVINTAATGLGSFSYLSELGITSDKKTGQLSLDSTKFTAALDSDFDGVSKLFSDSTQGVAVRMESIASQMLDSQDGMIQAREDGINSRIGFVEDRQSDMEYRLQLVEKRYRAQFSALDTLMSQMQSTSSYLSQQLASLPS